MQIVIDVITIAGFVIWVWWLLSTRTALKAIQRKLGADQKWEAKQQARGTAASKTPSGGEPAASRSNRSHLRH